MMAIRPEVTDRGARAVSRVRSLRSAWFLATGLLLVVGTTIQIVFFRSPITPDLHDFRQTQTLLLAREIARDGFDWRSQLPVFGPPFHVPFEFPIFQGLVALFSKLTGLDTDFSGQAVSLAFFQLAALCAAWLMRQWFSAATGITTLVLFELLPFGVKWGHAPLIDFFSVALVLLAVLFLDATGRTSARWVPAAAASICLSVLAGLVKPTTLVALAPLYLIPSLRYWRQDSTHDRAVRLGTVALAGVAALVAVAIWTSLADGVKSESPYTAWLTSMALSEWNYGTIPQRLDSTVWSTIFSYHWGAIIGFPLVYVLSCLVLFARSRGNPAAFVLPLVPIIGPLIFVNLFWVHNYYSIAVYPPLTMTLGAAAVASAQVFRGFARSLVLTCAVLVILLSAWLTEMGQGYLWLMRSPATLPEPAQAISRVVPEDSVVLLVNCSWSSAVPYYADRRALMAGNPGPWPLDENYALQSNITHAAICGSVGDNEIAELNRLLPIGWSAQEVQDSVFELARSQPGSDLQYSGAFSD